MTTMEIKTILNEGPADQFQVIGSKGRVLPNVLKAPTTAVIIPRIVKAKPSAVGGSAVNTAVCAPSNQQILERVHPAPKPAAATAAVSNEDVLKFVQRNQVAAHTSDTSASAAAKLKVVYAPLCCTGTPKNDPLCTCDFCMSPPPYKKPSRK